MGMELAAPEDVTEVMTQLTSQADELDRVAGYLGNEAREIRRLAGGSWDLNVPQVIVDQAREAISKLESVVSAAHSVWGDSQTAKYLIA